MGQKKTPEQLEKLLSYILERRPDEFGLVPDAEGYVKIKDLLKALGEEEDWKYVRRASIDEVLFTIRNPRIDIADDSRIRAENRERLPEQRVAENFPRLLYTCVREKAQVFATDKGIFPQGYPRVILSSDQAVAERIGRRSDRSPVLLTVQTQKAADHGVLFYQAGETLYLADFIPPDCFTGPPLPKQKAESGKTDKSEEKTAQRFPGSFFMELDEEHKQRLMRDKKKREILKEKDKRRMRKEKQKNRDDS